MTQNSNQHQTKYNTKFIAICAATVTFVGYKLFKSFGKSNKYIRIAHDRSNDNDRQQQKPIYIPLDELHLFEKEMFMSLGLSENDASTASDILCLSDKRGIDSHGVARLNTYFEKLSKKLINPTPKIKIIRESDTTATIDGDNGLGLIIGVRANEIAINKAQKHGSGFVAVCNSNHYGIAAYYTQQCLSKNCIGISMTNTSPLVTPTYGLERMLGTNPISIAFPGKHMDPIVIDMATSVVTYGKIEDAARKNQLIPKGWAIDNNGNDISSPNDVLLNGGLQLPLGGHDHIASHKGYCLSSMVDILCGVLSGANYNKHVEPVKPKGFANKHDKSLQRGKGRGHFFGVLKIDGFRDINTFKKHIDKWRMDMYKAKSIPNKTVLVPGDPEKKYEKIRPKTGIPVKPDVIDDIKMIAQYCKIDLPKVLQ